MDIDDFKTTRPYRRTEAARLLGVPETWIKEWVTDRAIPMQMSGTTRGVWFTYDNLHEIGRMLPALMTERQVSAQAKVTRRAQADGPAVPLGTFVQAEDQVKTSTADEAPIFGEASGVRDMARFRALRPLR